MNAPVDAARAAATPAATCRAECLALALALAATGCRADTVRVGSKNFTEGVLLGEVATRVCGAAGARVEHRRQLGGTTVLWRALHAGSIDAYAEYTGTLTGELIRGADPGDLPALRRMLAAQGIVMTAPLGFENTFALGMPERVAADRGLDTITDLRAQPDLVFALSHEFLGRADGWPGLSRTYGLTPREVRGVDHDLAYRALASGAAHVTDLYSTDAEIASNHLRALRDDRHYFPDYRAVLLYRADLVARSPACARALDALAAEIEQLLKDPAIAKERAAINAGVLQNVFDGPTRWSLVERDWGPDGNLAWLLESIRLARSSDKL